MSAIKFLCASLLLLVVCVSATDHHVHRFRQRLMSLEKIDPERIMQLAAPPTSPAPSFPATLAVFSGAPSTATTVDAKFLHYFKLNEMFVNKRLERPFECGTSGDAITVNYDEAKLKAINWHHLKSKSETEKKEGCYIRGHFFRRLLAFVAQHSGTDLSKIKALSLGSTTLESDVDVSLSGIDVAGIISAFNIRFVQLFAKPSAIIFDVNIYGSYWTFDAALSDRPSVYQKAKNSAGAEVDLYTLDASVRSEDANYFITAQHMFAMAKLINFHAEGKTDNFGTSQITLASTITSDRLSWTSTIGALLTQAGSRLTTIFTEAGYTDFNNLASAEIVNKRNENYATAVRNTATCLQSTSVKKAAGTMTLFTVACVHGLETYWTEGPFLDVVVNQQGGMGVAVTYHHYVDSLLENLADIVKVCKEISASSISFTDVFPKIGKYSYRAFHALRRLGEYISGVTIEAEKPREVATALNKAIETLGSSFEFLYKQYRELSPTGFVLNRGKGGAKKKLKDMVASTMSEHILKLYGEISPVLDMDPAIFDEDTVSPTDLLNFHAKFFLRALHLYDTAIPILHDKKLTDMHKTEGKKFLGFLNNPCS